MDPAEAFRALEQTEAMRREVAQRTQCPRHLHVALGLIMSTLSAAQATPLPYSVIAPVLCIVAAAFFVRAQRRRMGFFVNGWRRGRTLPVTVAILAYFMLLYYAGLWMKFDAHIWWGPLAAALPIFPGVVYGSYARQRAFRAEMSEGPRTMAP
jgi:hypothetical protein